MDFLKNLNNIFIRDSFGNPIHIGDDIQIISNYEDHSVIQPFHVVGFGYSNQLNKPIFFSRTDIFIWKNEQVAKLERLF